MYYCWLDSEIEITGIYYSISEKIGAETAYLVRSVIKHTKQVRICDEIPRGTPVNKSVRFIAKV